MQHIWGWIKLNFPKFAERQFWPVIPMMTNRPKFFCQSVWFIFCGFVCVADVDPRASKGLSLPAERLLHLARQAPDTASQRTEADGEAQQKNTAGMIVHAITDRSGHHHLPPTYWQTRMASVADHLRSLCSGLCRLHERGWSTIATCFKENKNLNNFTHADDRCQVTSYFSSTCITFQHLHIWIC